MTTIIPRTDLAVEFLQNWRAQGPWVLSASSPEPGTMTTQTFLYTQVEEMFGWIAKYQNVRNIYFTVNPVKHPTAIKPKKVDIAEMVTLHCDIDPRVGEDFEQERVRILKMLTEFKPQPSIIVDSGGGYQAYFILQESVLLDGTEETAQEYERYNQQLEILLGGDHCFNVDRLLRLPGTINLPSEKKLKKGRIAAISSVVEWNADRYPLNIFTKAPTKIQHAQIPGKELLPGGGEKIRISGNIAPLYVDDLEKSGVTIPDFIKVLIIHGYDPDNQHRYPSRSEPLFAVVCALVRAGLDDDTVAGVILNRDNKISASVLDKPRPERYAAKQIQDAKEEVIDPILRELNSKHAVIGDLSGKCRIVSEVFEYALNRPRISFSTFDDFRNRYLNRKVKVAEDKEGQDVMRPAGQWWLQHIQRRQYETLVFAPGKDIPQAYNLWQGFSCEALPGDCNLFLDHIKDNLCQGNKEYSNYLISWMARCVQQPDCPGEVAIVLRGEMGTGKGVFSKHFGSLFGRHFLQISDPKHLVGSFNAHLRDCVVLFGDEAFWAGDKKHESVLRMLITEEHLAIEAKGVDVMPAPNYTHLILASNSAWVVPAGTNERRFFVLDVGQDKMQDKKYFAAIKEQMNRGGREALLYNLMNHSITEFEVRDVPKTNALQDQKLLSYSAEESWWFEKLEEGRILKEHDAWEREVMKQALQDDYINFMHRIGIIRKASPTVLGKFLGKVCPGGVPKSYQRMAEVRMVGQHGEEYTKHRRVYFYLLPDIEECRMQWDKYHGGPFKWHDPLDKGVQQELVAEYPEGVFR